MHTKRQEWSTRAPWNPLTSTWICRFWTPRTWFWTLAVGVSPTFSAAKLWFFSCTDVKICINLRHFWGSFAKNWIIWPSWSKCSIFWPWFSMIFQHTKMRMFEVPMANTRSGWTAAFVGTWARSSSVATMLWRLEAFRGFWGFPTLQSRRKKKHTKKTHEVCAISWKLSKDDPC